MISHANRMGLSMGGIHGLRLNRIGGQITYGQLPTGAGSWNTGGGTITITNALTVSGLLTASARALVSNSANSSMAQFDQTGTNDASIVVSRSGGTTASWLIYIPTGATSFRINAGGGTDIMEFTSARAAALLPFRLKGYTVATLPAGTVGDTAYVTDALAPAFLTALVGGGAVVTPAFYDGTAWVAI